MSVTVFLILIFLVAVFVALASVFVAIFKTGWKYANKINRLVDNVLDDERLSGGVKHNSGKHDA